MAPLLEVLVRALRLGCTSFGGPVAHLGYFRRELVRGAQWVDDAAFGEIVALCSVLPGPTSSQVLMMLGLRRAGAAGAFAAWFGFTLPSALLLTAFGLTFRAAEGDGRFGSLAASPAYGGGLEGLAAAAAAVVLLAVIQLERSLVRTRVEAAIALGAFAAALAIDRFAPAFQWLPLLAGGAAGAAFGSGRALPLAAPSLAISRRAGLVAGGTFVALLAGLPIVADPHGYSGLFSTFFRAGSLVFGGGHVVLPFLQSLVGPDRVPERVFFAGYGAAQAMPGPLFTFAAFLGAADRHIGGPLAALVAVIGIFAPSFFLIVTAVPLWAAVRALPRAAAALGGVNAAVVGLLGAVFISPIAAGLVRDPAQIAIAALALGLLQWARLPAWSVVTLAGAAGAALRFAIHA